MKNSEIVLAGIAGTTAMTAFSYLVSEEQKRNFKEPDLIGKLIDDFLPEPAKKLSLPAGIAAHYLVGYGWSAAHLLALERLRVRPSLTNALLIGPLYGVLGALIWKAQFSVHPNPPKTSYLRYYGHLVLAHTLFTIGVNITAEALRKRRMREEVTRSNDKAVIEKYTKAEKKL